jgi:hypothetical protein
MYNTFPYNEVEYNALPASGGSSPNGELVPNDTTDPIFLGNEMSTITLDNNTSTIYL